MKKRLLSILFSIVLVIGMLPILSNVAHADYPNETVYLNGVTGQTTPAQTREGTNFNVVGYPNDSDGWVIGRLPYDGGTKNLNLTVTAKNNKKIMAVEMHLGYAFADLNTIVANQEGDITPNNMVILYESENGVSSVTFSSTVTTGDNNAFVQVQYLTVYYVDAPAHTHSWTYTRSVTGESITATCTAGCTDGYDTNGITLTLSAPTNLVCDGSAKTATLSGYPDTVPANLAAEPSIVYGHFEGNQFVEQAAPTEPGDYRATFIWGGKNAYVDFTLTAAAHTHSWTYTRSASKDSITATCTAGCPDGYDTNGITFTVVPPANLVCDGTAKTATLSGTYPSPAPANLAAQPTVITYHNVNDDPETPMSGAPTDAGDYFAELAWGDEYAFARFTLTAAANPYTVYDGDNAQWIDNSTNDVTVTFKATGDDSQTYNKFTTCSVDGGAALVEGTDFTKSQGSLIIKLLPAYLNTLSVGAHTLTVNFNDGGSATANFTVTAAAAPAPAAPLAGIPNTSTKGYNNSFLLVGLVLLGTCLFIKKKEQ